MGSHASYLHTKINILTKSSDKSRCWCSFRRFSKPNCSLSKILQIDDLLKFEVAKLVYGSLHNKTPNLFRKYFCKTNDRLSRATRQSPDCNNIHFPRYRTNKLQRCITYQEVKIWNCITANIRALSRKKFKSCYKNFLAIFVQILASKVFVCAFCLLFSHDIGTFLLR